MIDKNSLKNYFLKHLNPPQVFPPSYASSLLLPLSLFSPPTNAPPSFHPRRPIPFLPSATPPSISALLCSALLCWSSNHNPGPWQMEYRSEKLLTSQPEPLHTNCCLPLPASRAASAAYCHLHPPPPSISSGDRVSSWGMVRVLVHIWPH